jgi:hypothetical protein
MASFGDAMPQKCRAERRTRHDTSHSRRLQAQGFSQPEIDGDNL